MAHPETCIRIEDLSMGFGDYVVQRDLDIAIQRGDIFIVMGPSGCGKSTLLRHMLGLLQPQQGRIRYGDIDLFEADEEQRHALMQRIGILYQGGALWSSLSLAENVALPLLEYSGLDHATVQDLVRLKLSLVGLRGFEDHYPAEISGGMRKRAGLARAIALDPEFLFFDEPTAGLDPVSAHRLDQLILELRHSLGATLVIVTHDLASIFAIGTNSVYLDSDSKTSIAGGAPHRLLHESTDPRVIRFLTRGLGRHSRTGGDPHGR